MRPPTVLVTGGQGYLGSVLAPLLAKHGADVTVVDDESITRERQERPGITYITGDIRDPGDWASRLTGIDAVVHLAAIVGDPACDLAGDLARDTNYLGTIRLAEASKRAGVGQFVFASTCSTYGAAGDAPVGVDSPVEPRSLYAETKVFAEHYLLSHAGDGPRPSILRFATLHGLSPRMRFDLAVNTMTARAAADGRFMVHGGDQWRPFLHVRAAAEAVRTVLGATAPSLVYNCGSNAENYRIAALGELISAEVPDAEVDVVEAARDPRNYRVDFDPIENDLGFRPRLRVLDSVRDIAAAVRSGRYADHADARYNNYLLMVERTARQPVAR
ncbi:nucleoside-diphosphate-sugar epimerase [Actinokineospora baliensis]|uniref:NAD-dependent epimerase/dehydratase family protein n=1 Tax=Actinokineospora baliensis TaxID=547056 RepID=UPI00195E4D95|nr:SDR family oxidoreductase [Actinokineospora baliensis]MBM7776055.1 nucleoside-diphosphate-sugar epimerase [Actinokineospora baliensis]